MPRNGRPETGPGHYLRDLVYGALDGVITTLAVVAGATGAALGARVVVILGLANLVADGFSMGASNYLGLKSELEQSARSVGREKPWRHGLATFAAFAFAGAVPLLAFAFPVGPEARFPLASALAALALALVGAARAPFVRRSWWRCGAEMLGIGALAGAAAFAVGAGASRVVG